MRRRLSLKAKVLVPLVVLFILLEAIAITGSAVAAKNLARRDAVNELEQISSGLALHLNETVESYVHSVETAAFALKMHDELRSGMSHSGSDKRHEERHVRPLLADISRVGFESLMLASPGGDVTIAYGNGKQLDGGTGAEPFMNLAGDPCFVGPQYSEGVYVSPLGAAPGGHDRDVEADGTKHARMCFGKPFFLKDGSLGGVVIGVLDVKALVEQGFVATGGKAIYIYSLANGVLLGDAASESFAIEDVTSLPQSFWSGDSIPWDAESDGERSVGVATIVRTFSSAGSASDYWYVVAAVPESEVGATATRLAAGIAVASGVALAAAATALWFVVARAVRPLADLSRAAETVGRGDFSTRLSVRSGDELEELGESFNAMVEQLRHRDETLRDYQHSLVQTEKLAAIGTLAAGVAHEINNPLAFIKGNEQLADAILEGIEEDNAVEERIRNDVKEIRESLGVNATGVRRIERIVQSLRQFAKPSTEKQVVPLRVIVDSTITLSQNRIRASGVDVNVDLPDDLPPVRVNPDEIGQVVLNLLVNALDVLEGREGASILICGRRDGDNVTLFIQDNGPGIPEYVQRHIFTPFVTTKSTGTGLGLSISHRIIESHGGSLTFASDEGEGTTFSVALPTASAESSQAEDARTGLLSGARAMGGGAE